MMTPKDLYDQGSQQCRQYSMLTMQVRTMAQHVLIGYAVGLGIVLSRATDPASSSREVVLVFSGIVVVFAVVLWSLNHHYSNAFKRIRDDVLVPLEGRVPKNPLRNNAGGPLGPWSAHRVERNEHKRSTSVAWNLPFIALLFIGVAGILYAVCIMA